MHTMKQVFICFHLESICFSSSRVPSSICIYFFFFAITQAVDREKGKGKKGKKGKKSGKKSGKKKKKKKSGKKSGKKGKKGKKEKDLTPDR